MTRKNQSLIKGYINSEYKKSFVVKWGKKSRYRYLKPFSRFPNLTTNRTQEQESTGISLVYIL